MNIFDQFGIKEVADVTLYAIELNKYDEEIYIPVMYLNTLKVSTIEQTASQSFAKGGVGNPNLIAWDFGKEITLNLTDALYSPASQSLMWGGKFGINKTKIYGVWNPFIYPTDEQGRQQYVKKDVEPINEPVRKTDGTYLYARLQGGTYEFSFDFSTYPYLQIGSQVDELVNDIFDEDDPADPHTLRYIDTSEYLLFEVEGLADTNVNRLLIAKMSNNTDYKIWCAFGYVEDGGSFVTDSASYPDNGRNRELDDTWSNYLIQCPCDGGQKAIKMIPQDGHYKYLKNDSQDDTQDQLQLSTFNCPQDLPIVENEETETPIGYYASTELNKISWQENLIPEKSILTVDNFGEFTYTAYQLISNDSTEDAVCMYQEIDTCDEGTIKCTTDDVDADGYLWTYSDVKMSSLEGNMDVYYIDDVDMRIRISRRMNQKEIGLAYSDLHSTTFEPKIDIYKTIRYEVVNDNGFADIAKLKVKVGTFYIIDDWNANISPYDYIYEINSGIDDTPYLERMERCRAKQTFAIDANRNVKSSNCRYDVRYNNKPLTVFLDPKTMKPFEPNAEFYTTQDGTQVVGNLTIIKQNDVYYKWTRSKASDYSSLGHQIIVDAQHFPGTYRIVGETYARAYKDGQDQRYQFEIPLCKMSSETNLTLEASGEPTTFNMKFTVMQRDDGVMMKLTQYDVSENVVGGTSVVEDNSINDTNGFVEDNADAAHVERIKVVNSYNDTWVKMSNLKTYNLDNPIDGGVLYTDVDPQAPNPLNDSSTINLTFTNDAFTSNSVEYPITDGNSDPTIDTLIDIHNDTINVGVVETNTVLVSESQNYELYNCYEEVLVSGASRTHLSYIWTKIGDGQSKRYLNENELSINETENDFTIVVLTNGGDD